VLNSITAVIAALQTADALKILAGRGEYVQARLTTVDVWAGGIRQIAQPLPDPDCPHAARVISHIWKDAGARRSACADVTRCRSTSARGRSICAA
jgi:hypothetical protein